MKPAIQLVTTLVLFTAGGCASHFTSTPTKDSVELLLSKPFARQVLLFPSSNNFTPLVAVKKKTGYWSVTITNEDHFSYFYMVDNIVYVPDCQIKELDDFGGTNCLYTNKL